MLVDIEICWAYEYEVKYKKSNNMVAFLFMPKKLKNDLDYKNLCYLA